MTRDITPRDIQKALERLEKQHDRDGKPPDGDPSTSNPRGVSGEDTTPSASDHAAAILSDMSTLQLAKFVAISRNFDDTDSDPPDHSLMVSTDPIIPLTPYSKARADDSHGYLSEADKARLEVLTGGGEWIDVTSSDMAAAHQIEDDL